MSPQIIDKVSVETYYDVLSIPFDREVSEPHHISSIVDFKTLREDTQNFLLKLPIVQFTGNFKAGGLFRTNAQALDTNITILATENAHVTGTLTVNSSITLTINDGGRLVVT